MEKAGGNLGWICSSKEVYDFSFDLNEASEFAERTLSGRAFQIIGASYAKTESKMLSRFEN